MSRQRKWRVVLAVALALVALLAVVFKNQIRIAYHTGRLRDFGRYMLLESRHMTSNPPKRLSFLEEQWIRFGHGNYDEDLQAERRHVQALMDLGYLVREEFPLHHRLYDGTNRIVFHHQLTNTFAFGTWEAVQGDFWDMSGTQSNKIVITATKKLVPRWRKLVEDFDQP